MSDSKKALTKLRVRGRSFLALVLSPDPDLQSWLASLDKQIKKSAQFFFGKPVILNLEQLACDTQGLAELYDAMQERNIQVIAIEGGDPSWPVLSKWKNLYNLTGGRNVDSLTLPEPEEEKPPQPKHTPSLIIRDPVRSGQSVLFPEGDIIIISSVASGAEIVAGGNIHVYGSLRGRAIAGVSGQSKSCIFATHMQAELLAIDGYYMTAEEIDPKFFNKSAYAYLENDTIILLNLK